MSRINLHNIKDEADKALVDNSILPGVHTAEADDKIPGVDIVQEQDVDADLDFALADGGNVEPPLVDIPPPVNDAPVVSKVPTLMFMDSSNIYNNAIFYGYLRGN